MPIRLRSNKVRILVTSTEVPNEAALEKFVKQKKIEGLIVSDIRNLETKI